MSLTIEEVKKIAKLARIKLSDAEVLKQQNEINRILNWIEQLQEVNTDGIEPMTTAEEMSLPMREDKVAAVGERAVKEEVLANAPNSRYGYFVVNKVIE